MKGGGHKKVCIASLDCCLFDEMSLSLLLLTNRRSKREDEVVHLDLTPLQEMILPMNPLHFHPPTQLTSQMARQAKMKMKSLFMVQQQGRPGKNTVKVLANQRRPLPLQVRLRLQVTLRREIRRWRPERRWRSRS